MSLTKASQQGSQQNRSKAHRPVLTCPVPASDILTSACRCLWLGSGVLTSYEQIGEQSSLQTEAPALFFSRKPNWPFCKSSHLPAGYAVEPGQGITCRLQVISTLFIRSPSSWAAALATGTTGPTEQSISLDSEAMIID